MKIQKDKLRELIGVRKDAALKEQAKKQHEADLAGAAFTAAAVKWAKKVAALKAPTQEALGKISTTYKVGGHTYTFEPGSNYWLPNSYHEDRTIEQCNQDLAMLDLIDGDSVTISNARYGQWREYLPS
jgi:hypothetical protein